jgi:hypothetical protein
MEKIIAVPELAEDWSEPLTGRLAKLK